MKGEHRKDEAYKFRYSTLKGYEFYKWMIIKLNEHLN
jgi:hypothetical protein